MALQNLSDPMAFSNGAEVWLLPDARHSHWTRKIDWYLNFQILRASNHTAPRFDPNLLRLLHDENLATPTLGANNETPLMVSTAHRLPARYVVQLNYDSKLCAWLKKAATIWSQMNHPATRIFLPIGIDFDKCQAAWGAPESQNVSAVLDSDHQKAVGN